MNPMDPLKGNIKIRKRFAQIDLSSVTTAFKFTIANGTCTTGSLQAESDVVRTKIVELIGLTSIDRVQLSGMSCQNGSTIRANAQILPPSEESRFRNLRNSIPNHGSTHLFYRMKNSLKNQKDAGTRNLTYGSKTKEFEIRSMMIQVGSEDLKKFGNSFADKAEEERLSKYASNDNDLNFRKLNKDEMREQKDETNLLIGQLKNKDEEMKKKDEEMRERDKSNAKEINMIKMMLQKLLKAKKE